MVTLQHVAISVVGDGEQMRRRFVPALALVETNHVLVVDRQATVRVDGHAEQSGIRLIQAPHHHDNLRTRISCLLYKMKSNIIRTVLCVRESRMWTFRALCDGYNYDSTAVRRPFDCLSKVIKVTVT